jgi:hypothetical protein
VRIGRIDRIGTRELAAGREGSAVGQPGGGRGRVVGAIIARGALCLVAVGGSHGTLSEVAEAGRKLESFADYHLMDFTEADTPLSPLYVKLSDKGQVTPSLDAPAPDAQPIGNLYARPVRHSKPLFLLQEAATGGYHLSTDPALLSRKEPFANPYPEGDPKHEAFKNRVQYANHR